MAGGGDPSADASEAFREGAEFARQKRWTEALAAFQRAIALRPDSPAAHANAGVALRALGRPEAALEAYAEARTLGADSAALSRSIGNVLIDLGRHDQALAALDRALIHDSEDAETHHLRGRVLRVLDRTPEALAAFEAANRLRPGWAEGLVSEGVALRVLERPADALARYDAALALDPDDDTVRRHRANALIDLGRHAEAVAELDAVLVRTPDADGFIRKGVALQRQGRHKAALAAFDDAARLSPDLADIAFMRSLSRLALHEFAEGWRDYEHRWDATETFVGQSDGQVTPSIRERLTRWPTASVFAGKRLLVVGEQGVGDMLMFASILPDVLRDAASVTLVCEPRLRRLFAASFPGLALLAPVDAEHELGMFDEIVAIGSLAGAYRSDRGAFDGRPYLTPSAAAHRPGTKAGRLRVGLSWRGGVKATGHADRSIPLLGLAPVLAIPGVEFVSLQYGDTAHEAADAGLTVLDPATVADFDDLAATVLSMDLIVSVQTSLIHLAGALGAPCTVMVPHAAEWRYGASGETMPWYGSVRLVRQGPDRDWSPVIEHVAAEVRALAGAR